MPDERDDTPPPLGREMLLRLGADTLLRLGREMLLRLGADTLLRLGREMLRVGGV